MQAWAQPHVRYSLKPVWLVEPVCQVSGHVLIQVEPVCPCLGTFALVRASWTEWREWKRKCFESPVPHGHSRTNYAYWRKTLTAVLYLLYLLSLIFISLRSMLFLFEQTTKLIARTTTSCWFAALIAATGGSAGLFSFCGEHARQDDSIVLLTYTVHRTGHNEHTQTRKAAVSLLITNRIRILQYTQSSSQCEQQYLLQCYSVMLESKFLARKRRYYTSYYFNYYISYNIIILIITD